MGKNKPVTKTEVEEIQRLLKKNHTYRAVARIVGRGADLVGRIAKGDIPQHLTESESPNVSALYKESLIKIDSLTKELRLVQDTSKIYTACKPYPIKPKSGVPHSAVAFAVAGDAHLDEVVNPDEVQGLNEYNPRIAKARMDTFWKTAVSLLDMCRSRSKIDTMVLVLLGDFISGWIHEELIESNSMTPIEACEVMLEMLLSGIKFISEQSGLDKLLVVPVCGNHSRITKRKHAKGSNTKTYEWLIYRIAARWFAENNKMGNVSFQFSDGYFNNVIVYDKKIRVHHGDDIRYQGGVGGIHIPLRKAIAQWNKADRADFDILGHWHTRELSQDYLLNGSLVGWNEYAQKIKADYQKPSQSFFIWHPKYGATAHFPIIVQR